MRKYILFAAALLLPIVCSVCALGQVTAFTATAQPDLDRLPWSLSAPMHSATLDQSAGGLRLVSEHSPPGIESEGERSPKQKPPVLGPTRSISPDPQLSPRSSVTSIFRVIRLNSCGFKTVSTLRM